MTALIAVQFRHPTSNLEPRTPDFRPGTWHVIPDTCFSPFLCFHTYLRSHLHFLERRPESGDRRQNVSPHRVPKFDTGHWTSDLGHQTSDFGRLLMEISPKRESSKY